MPKKRLGDVLRERGDISANDLEKAVQDQRTGSLRLGEVLLESGVVSRNQLGAALEEITRIKFVDLNSASVDPEAVKVVPASVAAKLSVLPLRLEGNKLVVVMAEPQDLRATDELRFLSGREIVPQLGFRDQIKTAIARHYRQSPPAPAEPEEKPAGSDQVALPAGDIEFIATSSRESTLEAMKEFQADLLSKRTPAVMMVSTIIAAAADKRASDIHIDPHAAGAIVRLRVDGVLSELTQVPQQLLSSLVSRIKILADMDIAERRMPQDGRILVRLAARRFDLRVSTLPTHYGEKVVIRFLGTEGARVNFQELGLPPEDAKVLNGILSLPQGMLLVTGPTGSGKTTTLYTALNMLRTRNVNIITVEDPVEYMLDGVNHVQVHVKAGRTFANVLRSILRQDPNVIMVGEIRDAETAEIALTASQTGHLVLSSLHTNDSLAAITRLLDLGIPPYLIASSLTAVVAQRLVRKLCVCCREEPATTEQLERLMNAGMDLLDRVSVPVGCDACDRTGYKGRVGIYEILHLDEHLCTLISAGESAKELRTHARNAGLRPMQDQALEKVRMGITSLNEAFRAVPFAKAAAHCSSCGRELASAFLFCPYCGSDRRDAHPQGARVPVLQAPSLGGFKA